jgi:hypothetical protein
MNPADSFETCGKTQHGLTPKRAKKRAERLEGLSGKDEKLSLIVH